MSEQEWWANVYGAGGHASRYRHETRDEAVKGAMLPNRTTCPTLTARIHVRLKPEGAPRRYATEGERRFWEISQRGADSEGSAA